MAFLPVNDAEEICAARSAIDQLQSDHPAFTATRLDDSIISGFYRRQDGNWDYDRIALVFIDVPFADQKLHRLIELLRALIHDLYRQHNSEQEAIWVTATVLANDPTA